MEENIEKYFREMGKKMKAFMDADHAFQAEQEKFEKLVMQQMEKIHKIISSFTVHDNPARNFQFTGKTGLLNTLTKESTKVLLHYNQHQQFFEDIINRQTVNLQALAEIGKVIKSSKSEAQIQKQLKKFETKLAASENEVEPLKLHMKLEKELLLEELDGLKGMMGGFEN